MRAYMHICAHICIYACIYAFMHAYMFFPLLQHTRSRTQMRCAHGRVTITRGDGQNNSCANQQFSRAVSPAQRRSHSSQARLMKNKAVKLCNVISIQTDARQPRLPAASRWSQVRSKHSSHWSDMFGTLPKCWRQRLHQAIQLKQVRQYDQPPS